LRTISTNDCQTATGDGNAKAGKTPAIETACHSAIDMTNTTAVSPYDRRFALAERSLIRRSRGGREARLIGLPCSGSALALTAVS
jgi:hypothetical protein